MTALLLNIDFGYWQKTDIIVGVVAASLLVIVIGIQIWTTIQAKTAAEAAKISSDAAVEANRRAKEEMEIRLRPWISFDTLLEESVINSSGNVLSRLDHGTNMWTVPVSFEDLEVASSGSTLILTLPIVNTGLMPANALSITVERSSDQNTSEGCARKRDTKGRIIIGPNGNFPRRIEIPLDELLPSKPTFLAVCVFYEDRLSNTWITGITWRLDGSSVNIMQAFSPEPFD